MVNFANTVLFFAPQRKRLFILGDVSRQRLFFDLIAGNTDYTQRRFSFVFVWQHFLLE